MNSYDNKDDGIQYIDLDASDDGIEILDPDTLEEPQQSTTAPQAGNPAADTISAAGSRRAAIIRRVVMCVSAVVFLFSAGMLVYIFAGYHKADNIYQSVEQSVFTPVQQATASNPDTPALDNPQPPSIPLETGIVSGFTYNHAALLDINSDSVGYMIIPAINICLPVVQGSDNSFYLDHAVTGEYSGNGTLFIDYRIEEALDAANTIIYGHAMKNGSMFGSLYKLKNASFFNTGTNDTFYIYSGNNIYTYRIYSIHTTPAVSTAYTYSFADDDAFNAYIDDMITQSLVTTAVRPAPGDKTMTLSTCTNDDDIRLIVQAVRTAVTTQ